MVDPSSIVIDSFGCLLRGLRGPEQLWNSLLYFVRRVPDLRVGLKTVGPEPRVGELHGRQEGLLRSPRRG